MDELFTIEKELGEVAGIVSLQAEEESKDFCPEKWEEFAEAPKAEVKAPETDADGNPIEPPAEQPPAEGDEAAKPKFNPADYKWTITDRCARNLPQIFQDFKGEKGKHNVRKACAIDEDESVAKVNGLLEFVERVIYEESEGFSLYQQITFN